MVEKILKDDPYVRRLLSKRWYNMMDRCYNEKHPRYKDYGKMGITVDDRWKDKENFISDCVELPGYNRTLLLTINLMLDKDSLVEGNKVYGPDTCCFLLIDHSNKHKPQQMREFIATSPTGEVFESNNQSEFSKEHGLIQTSVSRCLLGKIRQHLGWTFKYK